jgi:S-adenosylmethionine hydrolase
MLTDFGTRDGYPAAMRAVIAGIAPEALVEDVTHDVPPGDIRAAAWTLATYSLMYPPGSIHLVVVDPGVGSMRRAIAVRSGGQIFVAPDNGVLTRVVDAEAETFEIRERAYRRDTVSATFHGRDIFAPAAAHLARGIPLEQLGPRALGTVRFDIPHAMRATAGAHTTIEGEVVHIDRFGNLITNIPGGELSSDVYDTAAGSSIEVIAGISADAPGGETVAVVGKSYFAVDSGSVIAYVGSAGTVEIGVRDGSAQVVTGMQRGARVIVRHTGAAQI